jgi:hypothetical protein
MDGKHIHSDIHILSKTSIYVPNGVMDAYFMLFNFRAIFPLLFGTNNNRTFLAQILHSINQATHLYVESCSRNPRVDARDNLKHLPLTPFHANLLIEIRC